MADLSISLEEYDSLRSERDKYKNESETWQKYCQDLAAGKIGAITRYDRVIPDHVIRFWSDEVWLQIINELNNNKRLSSIRDPYGDNIRFNSDMFSDERITQNIIKDCLVRFITEQCNTNSKPNINVSTKFTNVDEIINDVKKIWDEKFKKEYAVKVKETHQKNIEAKTLEQEAKLKLESLEKKFENDIFKKDEKIQYLTGENERALKRVDQLTDMLAESDRKYLQESMENTGLKDTIHNQKEKIDVIKSFQNTWWWKMFGPNIEF